MDRADFFAAIRDLDPAAIGSHRVKLILFILIFLAPLSFALAWEDPTGGKAFFPWLWEEQFRPTISKAGEPLQLSILAAGAGGTVAAHQYDPDVRDRYGDNRRMPADISHVGSALGSGAPGISIAIAQIVFDQRHGLAHARALSLTSLSAISTALIAQRDRPNHSDHLSFPSGHVSSSFTTATSLAYAYGPWVGVPSYAAAGFIAASRIADNAHWLSDTVSAAALGIFWGRASALADTSPGGSAWNRFMPVVVPGGALVGFETEY